MNNTKLFLKDYISTKTLKVKSLNNLSKKFEKIFIKTKKEVYVKKKTLNILNNNFKFNFKIKDLNRFDKFQNIAIIGMGGSILGAEALYSFFKKKIKKKVYFFNNLDEDKVSNFKKKKLF